MIIDSFKHKYIESYKLAGGIIENKITSDFILFCINREVSKDIHAAQQEIIDGFKKMYHDTYYTDEELKNLFPLNESEKKLIAMATYSKLLEKLETDLAEVLRDIAFEEEKINDPKTFSQEITEARSDKILYENKKRELDFCKDIIDSEYRKLDEQWKRHI